MYYLEYIFLQLCNIFNSDTGPLMMFFFIIAMTNSNYNSYNFSFYTSCFSDDSRFFIMIKFLYNESYKELSWESDTHKHAQ